MAVISREKMAFQVGYHLGRALMYLDQVEDYPKVALATALLNIEKAAEYLGQLGYAPEVRLLTDIHAFLSGFLREQRGPKEWHPRYGHAEEKIPLVAADILTIVREFEK